MSWPILAIFFALVIAVAPRSHQQLVASLQLVVLLTSSMVISSEYVADVLKQRALVAAVDDEMRDRVNLAIQTRDTLSEVLVMSDLAGYREKALGLWHGMKQSSLWMRLLLLAMSMRGFVIIGVTSGPVFWERGSE